MSRWSLGATASSNRDNLDKDPSPHQQLAVLPEQHLGRWRFLLLVVVVLMVYANGLGNSFSTRDDYDEIVNNPNLRSLHGIAGYFTRPVLFTSGEVSQSNYRPLKWLYLSLNYALWGSRPSGYHLSNVILHALNACLVYLLLRGSFSSAGLPLVIASLWAMHPVHTQAIAWRAVGAIALATLFALLALLRFLQATATPNRWRLGPPLLFVLSLLTYESVAPLPALALLLDATIARQRGEPAWPRLRRHWRLHLGFWTVLATYLLLRGTLLGFGTSLTLPGLTRDLGPRLLRVPQVLADYLMVFLVPLRLSLDRGGMLAPVRAVWEAAVLLPALLLLGLGALTVWLARRSPLAFFGGVWFGLTILPVSNLLPLYRAQAEHDLYLAGIGLAALGVSGVALAVEHVARAHPSIPWQQWALGLLVLLLAGYGARTVVRNRDWADYPTLLRATVTTTPTSLSAHYNLGLLYTRQGQLAAAEQEFTTALQLDPSSKAIQLQLASVHEQQGKVEQAEAAYRRLLERDPAYVPAYLHLGLLAQRQGRGKAAITEFQRALARKPEDVPSRNALGLAYLREGQVEAAIAEFQRALEHMPQDANARNNLASAYLQQGRVEAAITELEKAVALDPGNAALQHNLGLAYQRAGRADLAAEALRRSGEVLNNR